MFFRIANKKLGVLALIPASLLGIASPLCMYGIIPIAASSGPATKITNLGALKIVLGCRHFVLYFVYIVLFSVVTGLLINCF